MVTLASALDQLDATRAELLSLLAGLDEAALNRKGLVGDWSVKNVLAHLAAWKTGWCRRCRRASPPAPRQTSFASAPRMKTASTRPRSPSARSWPPTSS